MKPSGKRGNPHRDLRSLYFDLSITREQFLDYYRGHIRSVITTAHSGETMQFPASGLKAFVDRNGVQGTFCIQFSDEGKLVGITRYGGR